MVEGPFIFLLVLLVILVTAVLFTLWLAAAIVKAIVRPFLPRRSAPAVPSNVQTCGNTSCRTDNPPNARFCRRCGYSLPMLLKLRSDSAAA